MQGALDVTGSGDSSGSDKLSKIEALNQKLEGYYLRLAPTFEEMTGLQKTYDYFNHIVKEAMEKLGYQFDLVIYGSTANGLSIRGDSDLDLSLVIHNFPPEVESKDKTQQTDALNKA